MTATVTPIGAWANTVQRNAGGALRKTQFNVTKLIHEHEDWAGLVAYDEFKHVIIKRGVTPTAMSGIAKSTPEHTSSWSDVDTTKAVEWFEKNFSISPSREMVSAGVAHSAYVNRFHPVRDYLRSLTWDGTQRLHTLLPGLFGAHNIEYTQQIGCRFLIASVARVISPGCKVDTMLVLEGKQGAKKSSAMRALFGADWFSDTMPNLTRGENEAALAIRGVWGQEMPELDALRGANVTAVKAFLSKQSDRAREPYARTYQDYQRQCVFIGTTNDNHYLTDRSGNRRYWPVECRNIDLPAIQEQRDQLWAEAVARYESNEKWWLDTEELDAVARDEQRGRETREAWFELVAKWLEDPHVITEEGRRVLRGDDGLSTADILMGALKLRPADIGPAATQRIGYVMKKLRWLRRRVRISERLEYRYFLSGGWHDDAPDDEYQR